MAGETRPGQPMPLSAKLWIAGLIIALHLFRVLVYLLVFL